MLDRNRERKAEAYFVYLRKLNREEYTGRVTVDLFRGGIGSLEKEGEELIKVEFKETVNLK